MLFKHNPRKNLINDLKKSKELYIRLQSVAQNDPYFADRIQDNLDDINYFIQVIKNMPLNDLENLLKNSVDY